MKQNLSFQQKFIKVMLIFWLWVVAFIACALILYYLELPEHISRIIFFSLLPITFFTSVFIYYLLKRHSNKQFKAISKLIADYGPGEKCTQGIQLIIDKEDNLTLKNLFKFILANIYISEMADAKKALEVLETVDHVELFKNKDNYLKSMQAKYYYLLFISYSLLENNDAVCEVYNEALPIFKNFYDNDSHRLMWNSINFDRQKAQGNYDDALKIIEPYLNSEEYKIRTATSLDFADIYIKTGQLDKAEKILSEFDSRQNNVAMNKIYNIISERLQKAKENDPA